MVDEVLMAQVIVFSFSKRDCETLAGQMSGLELNNEDEQHQVRFLLSYDPHTGAWAFLNAACRSTDTWAEQELHPVSTWVSWSTTCVAKPAHAGRASSLAFTMT